MRTYEYKDLLMVPFQGGPILNNTYVIADVKHNACVVIDPSYEFDKALDFIREKKWKTEAFWLTHSHMDHIIGTPAAFDFDPPVPLAMHPEAESIRRNGGSARLNSGAPVFRSPDPSILLTDGMIMKVGEYPFEVRYTPGHAPGHCCFYAKDPGWLFTGDLVFYHDRGRTDLIGGSEEMEIASIKNKVLTLPNETIIFPGHEDFTSVGEERQFYE